MADANRKYFKTTREILETVESIHRGLQRRYQEQKEISSDRRAAMLLASIEQEEAAAGSAVSRYRASAPAEVLDAYFQFTADEWRQIEDLGAREPAADRSLDDVLAAAMTFDSLMETAYRRAAESAPGREAQEMFANLAALMRDKRTRTAQSGMQTRDL